MFLKDSVEPKLLPVKVLHCKNRNFRPFSPVTLTITRSPSYELNPYIPWRYYQSCESTSTLSKDYIHTHIQTGVSPGRKQWGGQKARVGLTASAERELITGVRGRSPPEAESILPLDHPNEGQNMPL